MHLSWVLEVLRETMSAEDARCMDDRDDREAFARAFDERLRHAASKASMAVKQRALAEVCSFCGKDRKEVALLITPYGRAVGDVQEPATICNECVTLCVELMSTRLHEQAKKRRG